VPAEGRRSGAASAALVLLERALRGRDDAFFKLFIDAADNAARAAALLSELLHGYPDTRDLVLRIRDLEHVGDEITHDVVNRLNRAVATPIERDDIHALSSALDDVVDFIDEAAAYLSLYGAEASMVQADAMARVLVDATQQLALAFRKFEHFESITEHTVEVHRLENEGDKLVRGAIASLFTERIDPMVVIRWKDIFERIEDAIDATERVAVVLEGTVIKNI
jgi:uncharacterized protein